MPIIKYCIDFEGNAKVLLPFVPNGSEKFKKKSQELILVARYRVILLSVEPPNSIKSFYPTFHHTLGPHGGFFTVSTVVKCAGQRLKGVNSTL